MTVIPPSVQTHGESPNYTIPASVCCGSKSYYVSMNLILYVFEKMQGIRLLQSLVFLAMRVAMLDPLY